MMLLAARAPDCVKNLAALTVAAVALAGAVLTLAEARAQAPDRALDMEIAREFLALELAGWRLPDPVEACLTELSLKRLEPMAFGSAEMIDLPEQVDPPGPHYRILRIEPEPGDRRRRLVRLEWLLPAPGGTVASEPDSFVFAINDADSRGGAAMLREPVRLVVRRECFGS